MTDREHDQHEEEIRAEHDEKLVGYWERIHVPRDHEDPDQRARRVAAASEARRQRAADDLARGPGRLHQRFGRQLRHRGKDFLAVTALMAVGLLIALGIISQQKAALPSWVPFFGQEFFYLEGELSTAQAVTPGQGQAVMIAGIEVGQIDSVRLEDGHAVVGMNIDPEYAPVIREDAELLLRPKTNLQDMVIEVDPGTPTADPIEDDATIPLSRTQPNVNPDQFLARLDADTREYLQLLIQGGAEGLAGGGKQLSKGLRRLQPFTHYIAKLNTALAKRRQAMARAIHNFGLLANELGRHNAEVSRFVRASADGLSGFANQSESIREALRELPSTLETTRGALTGANELSNELRPTLTALIPQAQALRPGLDAAGEFFRRTEPSLRTQLRPFTSEVRPVVNHTTQLADPFDHTVDKFGRALGHLNYGFNELAHHPSDKKPGYLFYLAWLNHNLNATYQLQDGAGPFRRGIVLVSCNSTDLAQSHVTTRPYLETVYQATNIPRREEICVQN